MKALNRIARLLHDADTPPQNPTRYNDAQACDLLLQYVRNPAALECPICKSFTIYVMAFVEAVPGKGGEHTIVDPVGEYAAALYCYGCQHAIAIIVPQ